MSMRDKETSIKFAILFLLQLVVVQLRAQITGQVLDAEDGYPVPYANVGYEGTNHHVQSDADGHFTIERRPGHVLVTSSVGYKAEKVKVRDNTSVLTIKIKSETTNMAEVEVRGRRKRYNRKENPAVALMRRVIEAKKLSDLENHPFYQFTKYQKITLARNDIDTTKLTPGKWYSDGVEKSDYNGKYVLPLTMSEVVTHHLYSKDPRKVRDMIVGQHSQGLNKLLQTGEMINTMLKEVFTDVNLYDDHIRLMQYPFPSPIGRTAISFYHFYIQDTVQVAGDSCYHLRFYPANQQDFGFTGDLYVLKDSTLHVKQCVLNIPKKSDVNWVKSMRIEQQFSQLDNGEWVLTHDDMWAEMSFPALLPNALVTRTTRLAEYKFDDIPRSLLRGKARTIEEANARIRDEEFWQRERPVELTKSEQNIDGLVDRIRRSKGFGVIMVGVKAFAENFIETSPTGEKSKVDIGPVNTIISHNFVDGYRFRGSARTMAALNPHLFWKGYGAYGTRSNRWYYGSEVTYAFNKKENSPFEYPMRNLVFSSERDVMSPSDKYLVNNKDNVFMSFRTQDVRQMYFYDRQQLSFVYESDWGLSVNAGVKAESNEVAGELHFQPVNGAPEVFKIRTTELSAGIRFCPGQTFVNTKQHRWPVNLDHPDADPYDGCERCAWRTVSAQSDRTQTLQAPMVGILGIRRFPCQCSRAMEQSAVSVAHHATRQYDFHGQRGDFQSDEQHGISHRPPAVCQCVVGHEWQAAQPPATPEETQVARILLCEGDVGRSDQQEQPAPASRRPDVVPPARRIPRNRQDTLLGDGGWCPQYLQYLWRDLRSPNDVPQL